MQKNGVASTTQSLGGGLEADKTIIGTLGTSDVEGELVDLAKSGQKLRFELYHADEVRPFFRAQAGQCGEGPHGRKVQERTASRQQAQRPGKGRRLARPVVDTEDGLFGFPGFSSGAERPRPSGAQQGGCRRDAGSTAAR